MPLIICSKKLSSKFSGLFSFFLNIVIIVLSISNYFANYVYDADFVNAEKKGYDKIIGKGNSLNNLFEIYPLAHFSESHFTGFNKKYAGMDWKSLRLVFQPYKNSFYLVAIIHDQWTT